MSLKANKKKKTKYQLPEWVHKIKIRFYKEIYPDENDNVIAKVRNLDNKIGYYMDLIEYDNKEAIVQFKQVARSTKIHIIKNTFSNEVPYPLMVMERSITKSKEDENEFDSDSDDEWDLTDESLDVRIFLTNRFLDESERKEVMTTFTRYKQIHSMLHNYGFMVKQALLTSQEEADNIDLDEYTKFLEGLAENTIWAYPKNEIVDIIHEIRNNIEKIDEYFELDDFHKEHFKNAICRSIPKTKYQGTCHIKMQTLEIEGVKVLKEALDMINKMGIKVQVISAPEYSLKMEAGDIEKIKDRFKTSLTDVATYMNQNMGFVQFVDCRVSNNMTEEIVNLQF